ncbi:MAG TPA: DUF4136 domain-containing protein [Vicinamibacterales bacterium]|nr:DUF4136 domain-containing protein [Vicinamibacterales bacterium]
MKRFLGAAAGLMVAAVAGGCASAISVSSHFDRAQDFKLYRTYDWGPADALPTGDPRLDRDPFFKDYFQGAVARQLARKGLELVPLGGKPDLLIHYHANISDRMDVDLADRASGYCANEVCPAESVWYEAGTLVLDFMDARSTKLVWRGWAQNDVAGMLRDRDEMARTIDRAVVKMMQRYPPSR